MKRLNRGAAEIAVSSRRWWPEANRAGRLARWSEVKASFRLFSHGRGAGGNSCVLSVLLDMWIMANRCW